MDMKFLLILFATLVNTCFGGGELSVKYALLSRYSEVPVEFGLSVVEPLSTNYTFRSYAGVRPDNFWLINGYVTRSIGPLELGIGGAVTSFPATETQLRLEAIGIIKLW